jgi:uncharacterized protein YlxW (UPF0749 family)
VVLVCGGLCVVSAVNSHGTDLRPGYTDLATLVGSEASSYKKLEQEVATLQKQVTALTNAVPDRDVKKAQQRADAVKAPAGLTAVTGPGVTVTLSDAPRDLIENTTGNVNAMVVHQQDIQAVANAMWNAGAEAVTIQGQRLISTTGIKCEGNQVTLHGIPYSPPYVIMGIGDPAAMEAELTTDPILATYRDYTLVPGGGVSWDMARLDSAVAPAYDGLLDLTYATPMPE